MASSPALEFAELSHYQWLSVPAWVFDVDTLRMVWANDAALAYWRADSADELLARNFDDASPAMRARLRAAHPQHVLARGFAWVTDANGQPVMRAGSLQPGQSVQAVFADGRAQAEIVSVQTGAAAQGQPGGKDASA